jgi:hypothetical protein
MSDQIRFRLIRDGSPVADGVFFEDRSVVLRWRGGHPSFQCYEKLTDMLEVHHVGRTESVRVSTIEWVDGTCFCCGAVGDFWQGPYGYGGQCRGCSASWDGEPSFCVEPDKGKWISVGTLPPREGDE